jgi:hypothetical protein
MKEGYVECQRCEIVIEVMLQDDVKPDSIVGGCCPDCGCMDCLQVVEE